MNYQEFLTRIIDDGIAAAKQSYSDPRNKDKLAGSIAGFEACRSLTPPDLKLLLESSNTATKDARENNRDRYWWFRCYAAEVEWVCNVVSCMLRNEGKPTIITPTARGMMKAAEIIGVSDT